MGRLRSVRVKGDTKTRKSRRVLKLPTRAVQALCAHHTRQAAERLAAGEIWHEHGLVFCREDGTPLDRWHVRKEFQKITQAARFGGESRPPRVTALVRVHPERPWCRWRTSATWSGSSTAVTGTVYRHEIRPAYQGRDPVAPGGAGRGKT